VSWRGWLAFAALAVIWGLPYFFIKLAVQELSPFVVAWGRIVLAASILLPIAWHRGALRSLGRRKGAVCTAVRYPPGAGLRRQSRRVTMISASAAVRSRALWALDANVAPSGDQCAQTGCSEPSAP
jgi:drug/metabolite transporter (DMT)-like permease